MMYTAGLKNAPTQLRKPLLHSKHYCKLPLWMLRFHINSLVMGRCVCAHTHIHKSALFYRMSAYLFSVSSLEASAPSWDFVKWYTFVRDTMQKLYLFTKCAVQIYFHSVFRGKCTFTKLHVSFLADYYFSYNYRSYVCIDRTMKYKTLCIKL